MEKVISDIRAKHLVIAGIMTEIVCPMVDYHAEHTNTLSKKALNTGLEAIKVFEVFINQATGKKMPFTAQAEEIEAKYKLLGNESNLPLVKICCQAMKKHIRAADIGSLTHKRIEKKAHRYRLKQLDELLSELQKVKLSKETIAYARQVEEFLDDVIEVVPE